MTTTPLAGDRARRARNPGDITGRRYAEQQAEQEARKAAARMSSEDIRKSIWSEAFDAGYDAGVAAVIKQLDADDAAEPGSEAEDK